MKYAVFTDIHGNKQALESIINDAKKRGINNIICLGDVIGIGPKSNECIDIIKENNIELILGNHELYLLCDNNINYKRPSAREHNEAIHKTISQENKEFLKTCKLYKELNNMIFEHFFIVNEKEKEPYLDLKSVQDKSYRKYINNKYTHYFIGHEHAKFEDNFNNTIIHCLGSSGLCKTNETFYNIITVDNDVNKEQVKVLFDRDKFIKDLLSTNYPQRDNLSKKYYNYEIK